MAYLYLGMFIKDLTADEQASVPAILANVLNNSAPEVPLNPTVQQWCFLNFIQALSSMPVNKLTC